MAIVASPNRVLRSHDGHASGLRITTARREWKCRKVCVSMRAGYRSRCASLGPLSRFSAFCHLVSPVVASGCLNESRDRRRKASPGNSHQRNLPDYLWIGDASALNTRNVGEMLRHEAYAKPGQHHRLDPVLSL